MGGFGTMGTHFGAGGGGGGGFSAGSPPSAAAETAQLFGFEDAATRPDVLYTFEDDVAANKGNLGAGGDGTVTALTYPVSTLSGFGDAGEFNGSSSKVAVGGANAPFRLNSGAGNRGDFELVFRFRVDSNTKTHSLLSTDPTTPANTDTGHYAVLLAASASADASRINFEYNIGGSLTTESFVVPGTLSTSADYHLVISFKTDVNTFAGSAAGVGKLRCYWSGVPCVLDGTSATFIAATMSGAGIGYSGSANWPLFLGQYLDGVASSGDGDAIYHLDGNLNDSAGSAHGAIAGLGLPSGSSQYVTGTTSGHGSQLKTYGGQQMNVAPTNYATIPDPKFGTGAFCIEFWHAPAATPVAWQGIMSTDNDGWVNTPRPDQFRIQSFYQSGGSYPISISVGTSNIYGYSYNYKAETLNVLKHWALTRTADSGGNQTWSLYVDGTRHCYDTLSTINSDSLGNNFRIGTSWQNGQPESIFDGLKITLGDTVYSGSALTVPPALPWPNPVDSATLFFDGKMDEFAVYNSRCLHNTDETFQVPAAPTRGTPLTQTSGMDSEGSHGTILTTKNTGIVLPKSIEGLSSGSAWSDSGTVKVVP